MALVSTSIPSMVNGVSQQPAALRLTSQAERQVNFMSSVVEGLRKRPPSRHVAKLSDGALGSAFLHTINRDVNERYIVMIREGELKVFEIDGTERSVSFPDGTSYLNSSEPASSYRAITIADYTLIANTSVTTEMDPSSVPTDRGVEAIVFVQQANYSTDYSITIDGYTATKTTDANDQVEQLSTSTIADQLRASLLANLTGFEITREGPVLWIRRTDKSDFEIKIEDSRSNTQMSLAKDKVQRFTDLPTIAPAGFVCEVVGDNSSNFDNYYVKFQPTNAAAIFDAGVWVETVKPGIATNFLSSTMPHALVRQADGNFVFQALSWDAREVGDADSAPEPTFVGRQISDVFFFKNRLGFLSDENVIFSSSGSFFRFFPSTVTTLVDSDPIDVAASHVKVSILRHAVPFNEQLLLFSDQTQFVIADEYLLTSSPPGVQVLTEFESSLRAKPVGAGKTVFFATKKGQYSGIREYFILPETNTQDAADITAHVPKYIPQGVVKLAAAANEDILFVLSDQEPSRVYVYKYYWSGNEKMQSSWSYWDFGADAKVLNFDFIDTDGYLIIQYPDGVHLEVLSVEPGRLDKHAPFEYHIDRKVSDNEVVSISFDAITEQTTFELPYEIYGDIQVITRHRESAVAGALPPGVVLQRKAVSGRTVTVDGDHRTTPVFIGTKYEARFQPSKQVIKEQALGGGQAIVGEGRLQLLYWTVVYADSGFFQADVTPEGRPTYQYKYTGRVLGSDTAIIGQVPIESGKFKFPVYSRNDAVVIELVNDTYLPCHFLSCEWEGRYNIRSRRL